MGRRAEKDILEVSTEEIAGVRRAVENSDFSPRYKAILLTLIEEIVTIKKTKQEKQAELERIRRMLEQSSEKRPKEDEKAEGEKKDAPPAKLPKNHGRLGAKDYRFARTIPHSHSELKPGQPCPDCDSGTLQEMEPRKVIRLKGNAPIEAELHQPARLRCGGCGTIFTAPLPPDVGE